VFVEEEFAKGERTHKDKKRGKATVRNVPTCGALSWSCALSTSIFPLNNTTIANQLGCLYSENIWQSLVQYDELIINESQKSVLL